MSDGLLFDFPTYRIKKPVRLIELFAGIGSQAKALENLNVNFEHWFVCEFDKYAIKSYNAIHHTNFETSDVTQIKGSDLRITDTKDYEYILTYSFPCVDLSMAGKGMARKDGLKRGSQTRSGLLWQVERLLNECQELPQILLMENVPEVAKTEGFEDWLQFLRSKGYVNHYDFLNAKNYGIPQNRNRCFCISILSADYVDYEFPKPVKLEKKLLDILEDKVDEKYYINNEKAQKLIKDIVSREDIKIYGNDKANYKPFNNAMSYPIHSQDFVRTGFMDIAPTLSARDYKDPKYVVKTAGNINPSDKGVSGVVTDVRGGGLHLP